MADAGDRPSDAGDTGPGGDRAKWTVLQVIAQLLRTLLEGIATLEPQVRRGGGSPSRLLHFPIAARSWGSLGAALAGRIGLATRSLRQCRRGAEAQRDCARDGAQWKEEMSALSLGVSQASAAKFSRMGRTLDCCIRFGRAPITRSSVSVVKTTMP